MNVCLAIFRNESTEESVMNCRRVFVFLYNRTLLIIQECSRPVLSVDRTYILCDKLNRFKVGLLNPFVKVTQNQSEKSESS